MRKIIFFITVFISALQIQAQIAVVNYMKVKPGGEDAFVASERTWKKLHQQRVNDGKMLAWELYYVYLQGTTSPYNYVTVDVYPDMKAALLGITTEEMKKMFGEKYADVLTKTNASRELAYSEMYSWAMGIQAKEVDKYLQVSYMKILKEGQYYDMEEKAYKPLHQGAIDMGNMNSWSVWSRPLWNNTSFDAVTVNGFTSADQMAKMSYSDEVFQKVTTGLKAGQLMEITNLMNNTGTIREMIRSQLWESLEQTTPKK